MSTDRYFARFDAERVPYALFRRHFDGHSAYEDQVLRDVGDWRADTRGSVSRAIAGLEGDLEEITSGHADEVLQMVAGRTYAPLATETGPQLWGAQGCPVCRLQWETGQPPRLVGENRADRSALHRCDECGTWWLRTERYAVAVEPDQIRDSYRDQLP